MKSDLDDDIGATVDIKRKKRRCSFCKRNAVYILLITSFVFLVAGIVFAITEALENWVEDAIKRGIVMKPGNKVYRKWRRPETPAYLTYHIFNVTNSDEVLSGGIPHLKEHGPYTYREITERDVLFRHVLTDSSITYVSKSYYVYDKKKSCASCDPKHDKIININLPFLTTLETVIQYVLAKKPQIISFAKQVLDDIFKSAGLKTFQTLSVEQLLWGYKDPELRKVYAILEKLAESQINQSLHFDFPEKFSLQGNHTVSYYAISSGENDYDMVGQYLMWRNKTSLPCWNSKYANMINGTGGHRFKPDPSKDDVLRVFVSDSYRSFDLMYDSTVHLKGIKLYRFALGCDQFLSGDICPENKDFCVTGKTKRCIPTGLMDVSRCTPQHAPIVFSLPHFYFGNKTLLKTVKGLFPIKQKHETFIDVEPHTGLSMRAHKRAQINVAVPSITGISAFENLTSVYLPIMFGDEHGTISDDDADDFKFEVLLPLKLAYAAPFVFIGIGFIILLLALFLCYRRYHKEREVASRNGLGERVHLLSSTSTNCDHGKSYGSSDTDD